MSIDQQKITKPVVESDRFDHEDYYEARSNNSILSSASGSQMEFDSVFDAFVFLRQHAPRMRPDSEIPPGRKMSADLLRQFVDLDEYDDLRRYTVGDSHYSAAGAASIKKLWATLPDDVQAAANDVDAARTHLDDLLNGVAPGDPPTPDIERAEQALDRADFALQQELDNNTAEIRQSARRRLKGAKDAIEADIDAAVALGWGSNNSRLPTVSAADRIKLAQYLRTDKRMVRIMREAGRLRSIALRKQMQKTDATRAEVESVELGSDFEMLVPEELVRLAVPELQISFCKDFAESSLLQWQCTDRETKGRGPIIVLIDCSGSMTGDADVWSKGVAFALYAIAQKQNRAFAAMTFNTAVEERVFAARHRPADIDDVFRVLSCGVSGGTAFESPLDEAVSVIESERESGVYEDADIVVITDDECDVSDEWVREFRRAKHKLEFSVYGVLIGASVNPDSGVGAFADRFLEFSGTAASEDDVADCVFSI